MGSSDGDFHYILRKTGSMLDFYGLPNGTDVSYRPEASFNDQGHFVSSAFNILPTEEELRIDIYHRGVLRTTIISDSNGKPLRVAEGRLLNVLVDFDIQKRSHLVNKSPRSSGAGFVHAQVGAAG